MLNYCPNCGHDLAQFKKQDMFGAGNIKLVPGDGGMGWGTAGGGGSVNDGCLHKNCSGCKNGTCSGAHMISCPCPSCSPRC